MSTSIHLAVDLGAESGRTVAGIYDGTYLRLEEIHRFTNKPIHYVDGLHWDIDMIFTHIKMGLAKAVERFGDDIISIGVDSWAIDYGLLDDNDDLLNPPFCYRDARHVGMMELAFDIVSEDRIYETTGVQFLPFNTIYQLLAEKIQRPDILDKTKNILLIPDLINFWLTGIKINERTNASTGQFYDPVKKTWATSLFDDLGLPTSILGEISDPGTRLGPMLKDVISETGAGHIEVVLPGTHDTASAVAAIPANHGDWAFLSSGTWSLLGQEVKDPIINSESREMNLANEIGVCDTIRLLKNTSGMWPLQQCRNTWNADGDSHTYADLTVMATQANPFSSIIDPDDPSFLAHGDMPRRIAQYCVKTSQQPPEQKGGFIRTILESLALRYRSILNGLEQTSRHQAKTLHVVGGGSQNKLLNQFTANCLNREVVSGPVEATASGNILIQLMSMGELSSLEQGRTLIRDSFELASFIPQDTQSWDEAYEKFISVTRTSQISN